MKILKQHKLDKLIKKRDKLTAELEKCTNEARQSAIKGELKVLNKKIKDLKFELENPDVDNSDTSQLVSEYFDLKRK